MKFKTRLLVTSIAIVLVPFLLASIAFLVVGSHVEDAESDPGLLDRKNLASAYTIENYSRMTEKVLKKVKDQIGENPSRLESKEYLDEISGELNDRFSYIIVRKGDGVYYTDNDMAAQKIFG